MIRKMAKQMLIAQVLSALTVSLCLLIDNIMIGNFIGIGGLTAYGLANPLLLCIGAIGSMLSAGVQVVCSKSLGKGLKEETDRGYSSAICIGGVISLITILVVLIFRYPLASFMGAAPEDKQLHADTSNYLLGFVLGAPGSMGALILVPFLQMAGQSNLLIFAVLGMTAADIALDYLFSVTLDMGMLGMGLASSLSYFVALLIGGWYFFSKKCVFSFKPRYISRQKMLELLRGGVPTVVGMATTIGLVFAMNRILLTAGGSDAVAAFSVIMTIGNAANCVTTGSGGVSLTLSSVFYHDEDRNGLLETLKALLRYSLIMGVFTTGLTVLFSPVMVRLFMPEAGNAQTLAIAGTRWFAFGIIFACINSAIRSAWQGTERILLTESLSVLEGFLLPTLAAVSFCALFGMDGVWAYYLAGEVLASAFIILRASWHAKRPCVHPRALLLLRKDFGAAEDQLLENDLSSIDDVMRFSQEASAFCLDRGLANLMANRVCVCIEEMGTNVVTYGFADRRSHHLNVRVLHKDDRWVLCFRDDCSAFDPVSHIHTANAEESLGIRILVGMAREIRYTYSLSLNNLVILLAQDGK